MVFSSEVYSTFTAMSSRTLLSDHVHICYKWVMVKILGVQIVWCVSCNGVVSCSGVLNCNGVVRCNSVVSCNGVVSCNCVVSCNGGEL